MSSARKAASRATEATRPRGRGQDRIALAQAPTEAANAPMREAAAVTLSMPDAVLDAIAQRVAAMLADEQHTPPRAPDPWIGVDEAARYLACKRSRVYSEVARAKDPRHPNPIPHERDGQRLLFRRGDLDEWVRQGGHREPRAGR